VGAGNNTAVGYQASYFNNNGTDNTSLGYRALYSNVSTGLNTAIGTQALYNLTTNGNCQAFGYGALYSCISGQQNVGVGFLSLQWGTTESYCTAVGNQALVNATGNNNTAIGFQAFTAITSGINNTGLGYMTVASAGTLNNATALGANSTVNASNKVRLGDATVSVVEGQVAYSFPSDGRFKTNVTEEVKGLEFINRLRPVVYNFDTRRFDEFLLQNQSDSMRNAIMSGKDYTTSTKIRQSGFIAQEVEKAAQEVGYDFNGVHKPADENDNYGLSYSLFTVPLVEAVQELSAKSDDQQKMIEALQQQNQLLQKQIDELKALNQK
jgi:hypothetical protein